VSLSPTNPAATVFLAAAGQIGYKFWRVLWCAAITSVIGASFTTISFWKTLVPVAKASEKIFISIFIILSTVIFVSVGQPVRLLILAGAVNGIILRLALSIMLIASHRSTLMHQYKHSIVLQIIGWMVVAAMSWMGWIAIQQNLSRLF
jgi:Mn2+/Fe2+ NRAMP family transporter